MRVSGRSKNRVSKFQAKVGLFGGIGMILFFVLVFVFRLETLGTIVFFVLWIGIVGASIYQNYTNVTSDEGIPHEEVTHSISLDSNSRQTKSYAQRMRELEQLKVDRLITEEEYLAKRADILDEDWGS